MLKKLSIFAARNIISVLVLGLMLSIASRLVGQEGAESNNYPLTADSVPHANIPHGEIFHFDLTHSSIFPNTSRTIFVYVPNEYKPDFPACLYVGLDGLGSNAPVVFDNLIAKHEMPITIAIGISPGTVDSVDGAINPRYDRSFEFDSKNDKLERFIVEELLPEVERHNTKDGRKIVFSSKADDHMIGGGSTGGIGAFTVAWEHPEMFGRVFSAIGTFVGMRGGESYYVQVRKTESKPIRIFMQDGSHDEWWGGPEMGDWWMSNQTMERALSFAGYDVQHAWGVGTHDGHQAAAVFPDAVRWLWHDWPKPLHAGVSGNPVLKSVLEDDSGWESAGETCPSDGNIAAGPNGKVYHWLTASRRVEEVMPNLSATGCASPLRGKNAEIAAAPDGQFYVADYARNEILSTSILHQHPRTVASGISAKNLTVRANGTIYVTTEGSEGRGEIWQLGADDHKKLVAGGLKYPSGLTFSPDGLWIFVSQSRSQMSFSYRVKQDGSLDSGEPFYDLYVPSGADGSGANSVYMDTDGLAYVATSAGVQIMDRNGRVAAILPLPENRPATSLCFGGEGLHTLYVSSGGKIYARKLKSAGVMPWASPTQLPKGSAG
jgi:gluconolactonase